MCQVLSETNTGMLTIANKKVFFCFLNISHASQKLRIYIIAKQYTCCEVPGGEILSRCRLPICLSGPEISLFNELRLCQAYQSFLLIQSTYSLKILACCYPEKFGGCRGYRGRPDGLLNGDSICCSIVRGNFCGCSRRSLETMFHNALFNSFSALVAL